MTEGNFVDYVKVNICSGNGGKGSAHFRREKYITKGGPDGGNGGRGGHVIVVADKSLWTLYHFKYQRHFKSDHGGDGSGSRSTGADGNDVYIRVPLGTIIKNSNTNEIIHETLKHGEEKIILEGGMGGLGNWNFKSSTNQSPRYSQPGINGKEMRIILELKVLADVGLVGFPNSGKSTLLKTITSAKPKIGNYEFTTLKPNLGIVEYRNYKSFIIADIPGIIEGASKGLGLGTKFLRHAFRTKFLLHLVDGTQDPEEALESFNVIEKELEDFESSKTKLISAVEQYNRNRDVKDQIKSIEQLPIDIISGTESAYIRDEEV